MDSSIEQVDIGNKNKIINFQKVCRACLSQRGLLRDIHNTKIPQMIEDCASVQVNENDGLPSKVCVSCFHLITKLYHFKKKLQQNDRILRQYAENLVAKASDVIDYTLNDIVDERDYEDLSEEDIPLSKRLGKIKDMDNLNDLQVDTSPKRGHLKELDITDHTIEDELESFKNEDPVQIFPDGPPPLIPLAPISRSTHCDPLVKDLPKDTPPLVPIKPLVNIDILENPIVNDDDIKYQCTACNLEFPSVAELKEHKLNVCQKNPLKCNICHKEFKESKKLISHLKGHMVTKDYCCKICKKRYPNPSTFRVHMRTHTGERPFKCHICDKGFVRWAGVIGHLKTHEDVKPFKCETCGKCFKVSSNLERHKILHSDKLPHCCSYCGKCFGQSDNLTLHIRTYHTNERPFLCSECGKGFVTSTRLKRHMWVHSGYKPYVCLSCPKTYSNSIDLKNHSRVHEGVKSYEKSYPCDVCDMKFYHSCKLVKHKKSHEHSYVCRICRKRYTTEFNLNRHVKDKHKIIYVAESILQPEGVGQIFVQYQSDERSSEEIFHSEENMSSKNIFHIENAERD